MTLKQHMNSAYGSLTEIITVDILITYYLFSNVILLTRDTSPFIAVTNIQINLNHSDYATWAAL